MGLYTVGLFYAFFDPIGAVCNKDCDGGIGLIVSQ